MQTPTPTPTPTRRTLTPGNGGLSAIGYRLSAITRGQALVETALTVGLLLLILFFCLSVYQRVQLRYTLSEAAMAGAYQAALIGGDDGPDGTVVRAVRHALSLGPVTQTGEATITVVCTAPCQRYQPITVTVAYDDVAWFPMFGGRVQMDAQATRASEKDRSAVAPVR